jgi:hypothetical protein
MLTKQSRLLAEARARLTFGSNYWDDLRIKGDFSIDLTVLEFSPLYLERSPFLVSLDNGNTCTLRVFLTVG